MKRSPMPPRKKAMDRGKPLERKTDFKASGNPERTKPLAKQSKKRQAENRQRRAMKNAMFPDGQHPLCVVPWCTRLADDLHEPRTRARGGSITDPDNGEPTCRNHNDQLTKEPAWGYELELLVHSWDTRTDAQIAEARRAALARWHAEHLREAS